MDKKAGANGEEGGSLYEELFERDNPELASAAKKQAATASDKARRAVIQ